MQLLTCRIGLNFVTFPKMGKFCQIFFSYFSQLLLLSSFFNKGNSCEIENSKNFDAMDEMIYFFEYVFTLQDNY